jgi:hypothetical protein
VVARAAEGDACIVAVAKSQTIEALNNKWAIVILNVPRAQARAKGRLTLVKKGGELQHCRPTLQL